jgi:hypothetical protein
MTQLPAEYHFCVKLIILWRQNDFTTAVFYLSAWHYTTDGQISVSLYQTSVQFPLSYCRSDTCDTADKIFGHGDSYCLKHSKINEVSLMFCFELLVTIYCAAGVHQGCSPPLHPHPNQNKKKFVDTASFSLSHNVPVAKISYWNCLMASTLECWKIE